MSTIQEDLDFVWETIKVIAAAILVLSGILAVLSIVGLPLLVVVVPELFAVADPLPRAWGLADLLARGSAFTGLTLIAGVAVVNLELAVLVHALRAGGKQGFEEALGKSRTDGSGRAAGRRRQAGDRARRICGNSLFPDYGALSTFWSC